MLENDLNRYETIYKSENAKKVIELIDALLHLSSRIGPGSPVLSQGFMNRIRSLFLIANNMRRNFEMY